MVGQGAWAKERKVLRVVSDLESATAGSDEAVATSTSQPGDQEREENGDEIGIVFVEQRAFLTFVRATRDAGTVSHSTTDTASRKGVNPRRRQPGGIDEI